MKISILCSDPGHPVFPCLKSWREINKPMHDVELVARSEELSGGDLLFLISCAEFITSSIRKKYKYTLVIHASDLPKGRGWSPLVWQVLEGKNEIVVSLLEAAESIDSGRIWEKQVLRLEGHELVNEINNILFKVELDLMDFAVQNFNKIMPEEQKNENATFYRKRTPEDSKLDPNLTLASQFDLLRICDPGRYPAYFEYRGFEYELRITKRKMK